MKKFPPVLAGVILAGTLTYTTTDAWTNYFQSPELVKTIDKTTKKVQENCDHLPVLNLYSIKSPDTNMEAILASCDPEVQEYVKRSQAWRMYLSKQDYNNYAIVEAINYYKDLVKLLSEVSPEARELIKTSMDWNLYVIKWHPDNYRFTLLTLYYYDRLLETYKQLSPESQEIVQQSKEWNNILKWLPDRKELALDSIKKIMATSSWKRY